MSKTNEVNENYFNTSNLVSAIKDLIDLMEMEAGLLKKGDARSVAALSDRKDELTKYIESQKRFIASGVNIEEKDKKSLSELAQKLHDMAKLNREEMAKSIYSINELVGVIYDQVSMQSSVVQYSKDGRKDNKTLKVDPPSISINEAI